MAGEDLGRWESLRLAETVRLFGNAPFRWWIAGGRALDLYAGRSWREHDDTDVGVPRSNLRDLWLFLGGWDIHVAAAGRLERWTGEVLRSELSQNNLWCRRHPEAPWVLDVTVSEGDSHSWVYRRDPTVRLPWTDAVLRTDEGVPFLAPELQLLFKSTGGREKDEVDARQMIPVLDVARRRRLRGLLAPDHPWQALIGADGNSSDLEPARCAAERFAGPVTGVRPFGGGHINDTFLVETATGGLVVQRLNTRVFPDPDAVTANILAVHRHLHGRLMPEPVATPDRQWLVRDESGSWRAWRRARGAPLLAADASPAALHAAGALLGRFHALLAGLDPAGLTETLPRFHDPGLRLADLRAAIAADSCGRVTTVSDEIGAALASEPLVEVAADLTSRVPRRVAHFDAKLDNILFTGDRAVCLVDFDTVMPGAWFWDVGDLLRSGATTAAEDEPDLDRVVVAPERYRAILDGYRNALGAGSAEPVELEAAEMAGAIVTYEQAVRFLTDWIAGDVYYRISRSHHNLDRARAQFRLLASMARP